MDEADVILAALAPVVDGLAATLGRTGEVVLHDFRTPEASVVRVAGEVTGRRAGGAMSEIGLATLARGDDAGNDLNYVTRLPSGAVIKSSTMPLKDSRGRLFGALCVNIDVTALRRAQDVIADLAGLTGRELPTTTFSDDFTDVVDEVIRSAEQELGRPADALTPSQRSRVVRDLETKGVFLVRGAAPRVAAALGISRASLYADLTKIRRTNQEPS